MYEKILLISERLSACFSPEKSAKNNTDKKRKIANEFSALSLLKTFTFLSFLQHSSDSTWKC